MSIAEVYVRTGIEERAARGAALLDEMCPGWADRVDLDILDMNDCDDCIVGQVFEDYREGLEDLGFDLERDDEYDFGFDLDDEAYKPSLTRAEAWHALAVAWRAEVRARTEVAP